MRLVLRSAMAVCGCLAAYGLAYIDYRWGDVGVPAAVFGGAATLAALVLPTAGLATASLLVSADRGVDRVKEEPPGTKRHETYAFWKAEVERGRDTMNLTLLGSAFVLAGFVLSIGALLHPHMVLWKHQPGWSAVTLKDDLVGGSLIGLTVGLLCYVPLTATLLSRDRFRASLSVMRAFDEEAEEQSGPVGAAAGVRPSGEQGHS